MNGTESSSHEAGNNYHLLLSEVYPLKDLLIEVILTIDHEYVEKEMLQKYLKRFGELPPLNRSI